MIKLIKSTFYKEKKTISALTAFLRTAKQLSYGTQCELFQKEFALWQGRKHCIFVNSGSSANLAIIQVLLNIGKLKRGDRVGFSAVTWSTNVMPIIELGLTAVPIDVELSTLNISSRTLADALSRYTLNALFLTHLLGFCDDVENIISWCNAHNIIVIEDTCESLGTEYKKIKLGNFGLASTFSFYVGHHMSTIEGGAVCTDDEDLATMLYLVRAHGWDRNLTYAKQSEIRKKFNVNSEFYSRYTFYDLGYNLRPTEIAGFLGRNQLPHLPEIIAKRQKNFEYFAEHLYSLPDTYYPIRTDHLDIVSNFAVPLICKTRQIRDDKVKQCDGKIEIRPIVGGDIVAQPFFKKYAGDTSLPPTPNAARIHTQGFYFANNPELSEKEKQTIVSILS